MIYSPACSVGSDVSCPKPSLPLAFNCFRLGVQHWPLKIKTSMRLRIVYISLVGFGNLSLLVFFPGGLSKWKKRAVQFPGPFQENGTARGFGPGDGARAQDAWRGFGVGSLKGLSPKCHPRNLAKSMFAFRRIFPHANGQRMQLGNMWHPPVMPAFHA